MKYKIKITSRWNKKEIEVKTREALKIWINYLNKKGIKHTIEERQ